MLPKKIFSSSPFFMLLLICVFFSGANTAFATDGRGIAGVSQDQDAAADKRLLVAVTPLESLSAEESNWGRMIADKVATALVKSGTFRLVERSRISVVLDEAHFGDSKLGSGQTAQQIANLLGADAVLAGSVGQLDDQLSIEVRLIDASDGHVLSVAEALTPCSHAGLTGAARTLVAQLAGKPVPQSASTPAVRATGKLMVLPAPADATVRVLTVKPKYHPGMALPAGTHLVEVAKSGYATAKQQVRVAPGKENTVQIALRPQGDSQAAEAVFQYNVLARKQGKGPLWQLRYGDALASGDHYKIIFSPDRERWVYVLQADSRGDIYNLFPARSFMGESLELSNPVAAGRTYTLPGPDKSYILDNATGEESIYFIMAEEPIQELETLAVNAGKVQEPESLRERIDALALADGGKAQGLQVGWVSGQNQESTAGRTVRPQGKECVNVLTFEHH